MERIMALSYSMLTHGGFVRAEWDRTKRSHAVMGIAEGALVAAMFRLSYGRSIGS